MTTFVQQNDEIEGDKLSGDSRDPLINRGLQFEYGRELYKFVAKDNACSVVTAILKNATKPISQSSAKNLGDNISNVAELIIFSISNKYKTSVVNKTGRHKTNEWNFKDQSLAKISKPNPNVINSIRNSLRDKKSK